MLKNAAFTIVAQNYTSFALVLADSMKESNPDVDFYIFFADGLSDQINDILVKRGVKGIDATLSEDASIFLDMAFYYEVTEYCTAIKPFVIHQLFSKGYGIVCYIDPDIYVYTSLAGTVFNTLNENSVFLTPHICSPIADECLPNEQEHLKTGTFNLGFVGVKNDDTGRAVAAWWMKKCRERCFSDPASGLFVDQKWMNLVPAIFGGIHISRHLGLNIAYWNLHERKIRNGKINDKYDLIFYHFSGIVFNDLNIISKYQNRYSLENRNDLKEYFTQYKNKYNEINTDLPVLPLYKYFKYINGRCVSLLARRFYYWERNHLKNPFLSIETEGVFIKHLEKNGVKEQFSDSSVTTPDDINSKAKYINFLMRCILRLVGPYKYTSLCKYFCFLSSIHRQLFLVGTRSKMNVINDNLEYLKR